MFRLTLDRRTGRKAKRPEEVFDLGAGKRNCIDCSARSGPREEVGYCCAAFVDAVTGAHLPAFDMRSDESACGIAAVGFSLAEVKSVADPTPHSYDPVTGAIVTALDNPLTFESPISDDPIVAPAGEERACVWCAHSFISYFDNLASGTYCARAVCRTSGNPLVVEEVRGSADLCGPAGEWFEEAPPMTEEEATILAGGGRTFYHW